MAINLEEDARQLQQDWNTNPRWQGVQRPYSATDVLRLRGTIQVEHSLARQGSEKLWGKLTQCGETDFISALGALSGNQAVQQVKAGLPAIYLSGWQVAGDANLAMETYPDQSLYPANSAPLLVRRINNALQRADQIHHLEDDHSVDWAAPIVADAEAGFGGVLNAYEIMKHFIEAGASGVHFEDQLAAAKKCGHMGGKVLVPTQEAVNKLIAARLASDVLGTPTLLVARTDALGAALLTSECDERDRPFITGERSVEGFFITRAGFDQAIARALEYARYADLLWCETAIPDLGFARRFAETIQRQFPDQMLAYNCSPSFNWKKHLDRATVDKFQHELAAMGYKFQFITLAGFHTLNYSMFELARNYQKHHMAAYMDFQESEFAAEVHGYTATRHQREVGAGYFDAVTTVVTGGQSSVTALDGSTEEAQFEEHPGLRAAR